MKYCSHCGNQLVDEAVICPKCGCPTDSYINPTPDVAPQRKNTYSVLSIVGFVFAFLEPLVGLICSIIAYKNASAELNERCKSFSKAGIIISAVILGIEVIYVIAVIIMVFLGIMTQGFYFDYYY